MGENRALEGRVAIITGAGGGLGRCHALELARHGARIVVNDLDEGAAGTVAQTIRENGGEAIAAVCSVTDEAAVARMVDRAIDAWGRIDVLVTMRASCATRASPRWTWRTSASFSTCT